MKYIEEIFDKIELEKFQRDNGMETVYMIQYVVFC